MARSEQKGQAEVARRGSGKEKPGGAAAAAMPAPAPPVAPAPAPAPSAAAAASARGMIELVNGAAAAAERASERARAASLHGLALRLAELKEFILRLEHDADGEVAELLDALSKRI